MENVMSGYAFVKDLHQKFGLLEAYRMAERYLKMQSDRGLGTTWCDEAEEKFCQEVRMAMYELDQI